MLPEAKSVVEDAFQASCGHQVHLSGRSAGGNPMFSGKEVTFLKAPQFMPVCESLAGQPREQVLMGKAL